MWLVVWYHRAIISYHIVSYRFSKTKQTKQNKQATMPTFQDTAPGTKSSKFTALDPFAPFLAQPVRFYICTLHVARLRLHHLGQINLLQCVCVCVCVCCMYDRHISSIIVVLMCFYFLSMCVFCLCRVIMIPTMMYLWYRT